MVKTNNCYVYRQIVFYEKLNYQFSETSEFFKKQNQSKEQLLRVDLIEIGLMIEFVHG